MSFWRTFLLVFISIVAATVMLCAIGVAIYYAFQVHDILGAIVALSLFSLLVTAAIEV